MAVQPLHLSFHELQCFMFFLQFDRHGCFLKALPTRYQNCRQCSECGFTFSAKWWRLCKKFSNARKGRTCRLFLTSLWKINLWHLFHHFFDCNVIKQIVLVSTLLHKSFYFISATFNKIIYKTTCSQHFKLKREDKWVRHWNCYTIAISAILYQWDACGRDFSDISFLYQYQC